MSSTLLYPSTPIKIKSHDNEENIPSSTAETKANKLCTPKVDYKTRTFELMSEVSQLKSKQKHYETEIEILEEKIKNAEKQVSKFLEQVQCKDFNQVLQMVRELRKYKKIHQSQVLETKNLKHLVSQYRQQIQLNIDKEQAKIRSKSTQKKIQQIQNQSQAKLHKLTQQNKKLKTDLKQIKYQYQKLVCENSELQQHIQQLRMSLKKSIESYEQIQVAVEEKMKEYIQKIKEYQEIIAKNKNQQALRRQNALNLHRVKEQESEQILHKFDFSFGKESEPESSQSPPQKNPSKNQSANAEIQELQMNIQCYRASIEGLLEQNKKLKKSFQALYKMKEGQTLPEQLIKQISIMRSIIELSQNMESI